MRDSLAPKTDAAERMSWRWIGIDITQMAIKVIGDRLRKDKGVPYPAWSATGTYTSAPRARPQEEWATQQALWPRDGGAGTTVRPGR